MTLPADWREWASDDPADHPDDCACLIGADQSPTGRAYCVLAYDAHLYEPGEADA